MSRGFSEKYVKRCGEFRINKMYKKYKVTVIIGFERIKPSIKIKKTLKWVILQSLIHA